MAPVTESSPCSRLVTREYSLSRSLLSVSMAAASRRASFWVSLATVCICCACRVRSAAATCSRAATGIARSSWPAARIWANTSRHCRTFCRYAARSAPLKTRRSISVLYAPTRFLPKKIRVMIDFLVEITKTDDRGKLSLAPVMDEAEGASLASRGFELKASLAMAIGIVVDKGTEHAHPVHLPGQEFHDPQLDDLTARVTGIESGQVITTGVLNVRRFEQRPTEILRWLAAGPSQLIHDAVDARFFVT